MSGESATSLRPLLAALLIAAALLVQGHLLGTALAIDEAPAPPKPPEARVPRAAATVMAAPPS
ncbi:hypothetical protein, partial [Methylobacterium sp. E-066]|uniref:hypothetical protein n=1 Tax=Methylobacterium sp. E-066 TaxID=2836584 RepID=UPI001FB8B8C8